MTHSHKIIVFVVVMCAIGGLVYVGMQKKDEEPTVANMLNNEITVAEHEVTQSVIHEVASQEELDALLKLKDKPLVVKFSATWCPPCKKLLPIYKAVGSADSLPINKYFRFAEVDVDKVKSDLVQSMPTIIIFVNGKEFDRISGFVPKRELIQKLEAIWQKLEQKSETKEQ